MQHIQVYIIKNSPFPPFPSSPSFDQWLLISPALHTGAREEKSFTCVVSLDLDSKWPLKAQMWSEDSGNPPASPSALCWVANEDIFVLRETLLGYEYNFLLGGKTSSSQG